MDLAKVEIFSQGPTVIIDRSALIHNLRWLNKTVGKSRIFMILKGNAHAHAPLPTARIAQKAGIKDFGVLTLELAVKLRKNGIRGRIFTWQHEPDRDFSEAIRMRIELGAATSQQLENMARAAKAAGRAGIVHLKVDVGLSRGGATLAEWPALLAKAKTLQNQRALKIAGVWSHLPNASAEADKACLKTFNRAADMAKQAGFSFERHLAASIAAIRLPESRFERVRLGLSCFGHCSETDQLIGSMTIVAPVLGPLPTKDLSEPTRLLVGFGYAHGALALAVNKGYYLIGGLPCKVLEIGPESSIVESPPPARSDKFGANCRLPDNLKSSALILGPGNYGEMTVEDWAGAAMTTSDDVLSRISAVLIRRYV